MTPQDPAGSADKLPASHPYQS